MTPEAKGAIPSLVQFVKGIFSQGVTDTLPESLLSRRAETKAMHEFDLVPVSKLKGYSPDAKIYDYAGREVIGLPPRYGSDPLTLDGRSYVERF